MNIITSQQPNMFSPIWKPELLFVPHVHHGEKLTQTHSIDMYSKNTEMLDLEASLLQCVDPHEVNPLPDSDKGSTGYLLNFNVTNVEIAESGELYDPQTKIKLEMEEFKDLSGFLPDRQPIASNSIDELNTPVFDKDAFEFPVMPMKSTPYDHKLNNDYFGNLYPQQNKDLMNRLQQGSQFSNISNIQQNNDISNYISPPSGSSNGNVYYSDCESPPYNSLQTYGHINTPEDSNSSNNSAEATTQLYLNVNLNPLTENTINTPEVINTVTELDNFNILDIVQAEELRTVDVDDIFSPYVKPENTSDNKRSRRRRKLSYDSDDEYIPPTKSARKNTQDSSDSDSEYEQHTSKRGRTRKAPSVSSNDGVTKYREIRDKNNEASRKSRQKRKQKEQELEKECDELNARNIKLKAQVEELEKTVSSYRDNLFKIMLRK